jgi:hypothetical protein
LINVNQTTDSMEPDDRGLLLQVRPLRPAAHPRDSKHELKQRIAAGIDDVNRHPVIHTWSYKLAELPDMIRAWKR